MGQVLFPAALRSSVDRETLKFTALLLGSCLAIAGCGQGPTDGNSSEPAGLSADDHSGFRLPPDFKTVDLPLEKRKDVFKEAHGVRALAVQEANAELPMDEAHLPHLDTKAFDKRVADHKAIIQRILAKNLAVLAEKYKISVADVEKVEDEANKLRWFPPADPVFQQKESGARPGTQPEVNTEIQTKGSK